MSKDRKPVVVLDPGHGGKDSGAKGPTGLKEKVVVLVVALLVKAILTPYCRVILTRSKDVFVTLPGRVKIANQAKADVYVSIHCNSFTKPVMGIETFINRQTQVSFPLGEALQDRMTDAFPNHTDRGLKRAGYHVLRHTKMAAALVELEFIHVVCGERHLANKSNQRKYAEAIADGVLDFLDLSRKPLVEHEDPSEPVPCKALEMSEQIDGVITQLERIKELA